MVVAVEFPDSGHMVERVGAPLHSLVPDASKGGKL